MSEMFRALWLVDHQNSEELHTIFVDHSEVNDYLAVNASCRKVIGYFGSEQAARQLVDFYSEHPGYASVEWFRFPLSYRDRAGLLKEQMRWLRQDEAARDGTEIADSFIEYGTGTKACIDMPSDLSSKLSALSEALSKGELTRAIWMLEQLIRPTHSSFYGDLWQSALSVYRSYRYILVMEARALEDPTPVAAGRQHWQIYDASSQLASDGYQKVASYIIAHQAQLKVWRGFDRRAEFLSFIGAASRQFIMEHVSGRYRSATAIVLLSYIIHFIGASIYSQASKQLTHAFLNLWKALELLLYSSSLRSGTALLNGAEVRHVPNGPGKSIGVWYAKVAPAWSQRYPAVVIRQIEESIDFRNASRVGHVLSVPSHAQVDGLREALNIIVEKECSRDGLLLELALLRDAHVDGTLCTAVRQGIGESLVGRYSLPSALGS